MIQRYQKGSRMSQAVSYGGLVYIAGQVAENRKAGIEDQTRCGLRGSPTVVRKVFAPKPRQEKAKLIDTAGLAAPGGG